MRQSPGRVPGGYDGYLDSDTLRQQMLKGGAGRQDRDLWQDHFESFKNWWKQHARMPQCGADSEEEQQFANWLKAQRRAFQTGELDESRKAKLAQVPTLLTRLALTDVHLAGAAAVWLTASDDELGELAERLASRSPARPAEGTHSEGGGEEEVPQLHEETAEANPPQDIGNWREEITEADQLQEALTPWLEEDISQPPGITRDLAADPPQEQQTTSKPRAKSWWRLAKKYKLSKEQQHFVDTCREMDDNTCLLLHGATGTGKTLAMAAAVADQKLPTIWLVPNKTLARQVVAELKEYLPHSHVECYMSQFRCFVPSFVRTDGEYAAQTCSIDRELALERARALKAIKSGKPVLMVASTSAVYGTSMWLEEDSLAETKSVKFQVPKSEIKAFVRRIRKSLDVDLKWLLERGGSAKAARQLEMLVNDDIESIEETGTCKEMMDKYGCFLETSRLMTVFHHFKEVYGKEWALIFDESHVMIPGISSPAKASTTRKGKLNKHGFRVRDALQTNPLSLKEVFDLASKTVILGTATPNNKHLTGHCSRDILTVKMEQRPTHILDPIIHCEINKELTDAGVLQLMVEEIEAVRPKGQQVLIIAATKLDAKVIAEKLTDDDIPADCMLSTHSPAERDDILRRFRESQFDVLVGVNLLREGLDLPSVSRVLVMHADLPGFLRSTQSLVQIAGRAARHIDGQVVFYAKRMSEAMRECIEETSKRRAAQENFNKEKGFVPAPLKKRQPIVSAHTSQSRPAGGQWVASANDTAAPERRRSRRCFDEKGGGRRGFGAEDSSRECSNWEIQASVGQRCDQLALVGDGKQGGRIAPGVPQIGRICSMRLLKKYFSLENLLRRLRTRKASDVGVPGFSEGRRLRILENAAELRESKKMIQLEWCYKSDEVTFNLLTPSKDVWGKPFTDWRSEASRIRGGVCHEEDKARAAATEGPEDPEAAARPSGREGALDAQSEEVSLETRAPKECIEASP